MNTNKSHYIDGQWLIGQGLLFTSVNPANEEPVWQGREATSEEILSAIQAARKASPAWSNLDLNTRIQFLNAFADTVTKNSQRLAEAISKETGKPLWETKTEVQAVIAKIPISIEAHRQRCYDSSKDLPQAKNIVHHRPHGVLAVLGPFNFPAHLPNGHIIPSLLAGNTLVFKPSELTPYVAQLLVECWENAKLPSGVLNLIQGAAKVGQELSSSPLIDGLLFTGSWPTGRRLAQQFAETPYKILALEMGGNNPFIVSTIDNPEAAAYTTIQSAFLSSGQRCTCARRLIVPKGQIGDAFLDKLVAMTQTITIGAYSDSPEPFMGPVISAKAASAIIEKQNTLLALGAHPLLPLTQPRKNKAFLTPGLIDVTPVATRPDEEIFGPFLQVIRVPDFAAAIEEANNTKYGLAAGLLSNSLEEYRTFYSQIRAGVINWNTQLTGASSGAPFGGIGQSGNNRPSGFYAADYCAYPVASMENTSLNLPKNLTPGIRLD